ncbi:hypothetical protein QJS04_geneDACA002505 [Acorus gramineus]|uniref:Neprosin PEP catalytic domain-containing protein n=1 Tax=Acorus gramineus TaxID=55184 RepID=A0AAV9ATB1_ACOGR|nr:hypothetical protein QJS04_geneDACA002505 [Acorus gramineus]
MQSEDGDIIDCVDIYKQPAFDHPLLKNHTIQSGSCPKGTIPVRRVTKHDLSRAPYLQRYGMKEPETFRAVINGDSSIGLLPNHSVNIAIALGNSYHGGQVDLTVWNPFVEPDDYSTASMAFKSGPYDNFEAMEVGWMDIKTGNWWLQYGTNELVGYWPSSIFGPLGHMAVAVQWGGDVYSPKIGQKPHTHTGMGSGHYGMDTFGACSAAHMRVRDNSATEYRPEKLATIIDEFDCYNYIFYPGHGEDRSFYFGGPGGKDFLCQ